jgi:hypothetical protein
MMPMMVYMMLVLLVVWLAPMTVLVMSPPVYGQWL